MPDNRPFHGQAVQINQSIFADWAGLPSAVADFDFCAVRPGNDLLVRWKSNHTVYPSILHERQACFLGYTTGTETGAGRKIRASHLMPATDQL